MRTKLFWFLTLWMGLSANLLAQPKLYLGPRKAQTTVPMAAPELAPLGTLIEYERITRKAVPALLAQASPRAYAELTQQPQLSTVMGEQLQYPVTYYRVVYQTEDQGQPLKASGLVIIPEGKGATPLLGYLHGTILPSLKATAPSRYGALEMDLPLLGNFEVNMIGSVMASHGYVVAMPDYPGYGASEGHPIRYTYTPTLARVSRDMLRATRQLCRALGAALTEELYLTGYSEGGGAAMALHQLLEADPDQEFTVTAQSSMSGFYHYSRMCAEFAHSEAVQPAAPIYLWSAWVLNENHPGLQRPQASLFRHFYRETPEHFMLKAPWLSLRRKTSANLLNRDFHRALREQSDSTWLMAAQINDHYDWQARAPIFLHHGEQDHILPIFHSQDAYTHMQARGSAVTLYAYPAADHFSLIDEYVRQTLEDFDAIRPAGNFEF